MLNKCLLNDHDLVVLHFLIRENIPNVLKHMETQRTLSKLTVGGSHGKESACNVGEPGSIPGLRRSPGEGNGNPLAWRIPETEEPGGLQPIGLQRVRHDFVMEHKHIISLV